MRYWYLKGGDVSGPLSAQEIASDSDFSAEVLVCPEPNSGDETFWKSPSAYAEDFGPFIKIEPVIADTPSAPAVKEAQVPAQARIATPVKAAPVVSVPAQSPVVAAAVKPSAAVKKESLPSSDFAALAAVSPEETIHTQSPLNVALEDNLLEDLPAKALLAKDEPKEEEPQEPEQEIKKAEEKPHPADPLIAVIENQKPLQSFREEDFTLVSPAKPSAKPAARPSKESDKEGSLFKQKQERAAPIIMKPMGAAPLQKAKVAAVKQEVPAELPRQHSDKKPLPVETFSSGSGVVHIKQDGEEVPSAEEQLKEKAPSKEKSFFSAMSEEKPIIHTGEETDAPFPFGGEMKTAEVSELISEEPSSPFLQVKEQQPHSAAQTQDEEEPLIPSSSGDRVPGGIMPTTNGKIISSSDGRLEDKKPKNDVIYLLVISMFLFTGIALFMTFFGDKKGDKQPALPAAAAQTQKEEQPVKPVLQGIEEGIASPEAQQPSAVKTPDIVHEKGAIIQQDAEAGKTQAQEIVKKYLLDESRGTIADFLTKTYGGGMYQTAWSSSPLYADTYVVDFTASKVRAEPIVYLFRVDIKKGVVTGGLNGITMDLLAVK